MIGDAPTRQIMPYLDAEIERALTDSIKAFGVLTPIIVDQDRRIIDGHNRARIAAELLIPCPEHKIHVENEADALEYAATLNLDRRTFSPETRRTVVLHLAELNYSQRAIAGAVKVSQATVNNDLKADDPQVNSRCSPGTQPKITGRDGKAYPAKAFERTPAEREAILVEYENGVTQTAIGERMGLSSQTIGYHIKKAREARLGSPANPTRSETTKHRESTIREMAAAGRTSRQIAAALDVPVAAIWPIANRIGVSVTVDKSRLHDSARIASEVSFTLEGAASAVQLVDFGDLDTALIDGWVTSMAGSLHVLKQFHNQLKEMTQ